MARRHTLVWWEPRRAGGIVGRPLQAVVDKATGVILQREAGEADGSFKQVEALERFTTLPLNRHTKKLLAWHDHPGAERVDKKGHKLPSHRH